VKPVIRKATITDVDAVAELFDQYRIWYGKESDISRAIEFLKARINNDESIVFIAFEGDVITGFTQLYPVFSSMRMQRQWLLNDLFVKNEYRGKGISKALLERAKELCRETNACGFTLETGKSNDIGNKLYPAVGMELNTEFNFYNWDVK
jgi:GNAT superfamily N-acetyltransferase